MTKELYQWQEECLERWFANHGRGMVQAVTGSGKTLLALTAAKRLEEKLGREVRVKIVVPTGSLMQQWNRALRKFHAELSGESEGGEESKTERETKGDAKKPSEKIGMRGGGCKASTDCKYMIYVINSARYELARQILAELRAGEAVLLIADECHHYESGQNRLIFEFLPYIGPDEQLFFSLGLSATLPSGQAGHYLASVLGKKIYHYGMRKAVEMQTVCQYNLYHVALSFQEEERAEYEDLSGRMKNLYGRLLQIYPFLAKMDQKGQFEMLRRLAGEGKGKAAGLATGYMNCAYRRKKLVCLAAARISCVLDLVERLGAEEKILIFGERVNQAEELYSLLQERWPGRVGRYHSKMGQQANKNVLDRFREGEVRILIACKALDEGMDVPEVSAGIILSGTSTQRQRLQRLGRIIRKKENGCRASLYYLHVVETQEDSCFLPEGSENQTLELEYFPETREFFHPVYREMAGRLLENMYGQGAASEKLEEAQRCLRMGSVRSDWLLPCSEIDGQIAKAGDAGDRNYWICMKKLHSFLFSRLR